MRTPEPPDRDDREDSPPRLSRPKRTTRPPNSYAREQEIDNEQRKTRPQQREKPQIEPEAQRDVASSDDSRSRVTTAIGEGACVLRDELYPIKVDSFNKAAVLDEKDEIRVGAAAAFSEENETTAAKITWFSRRDNAKSYGSMVVYLTKGTDAQRHLADGFFHAGGESFINNLS
ncbi:hypothetical protein N7490_006262 [Penicillium lividum]|nr:hypothetical protein N7490_006262 [Penicillium lividum]